MVWEDQREREKTRKRDGEVFDCSEIDLKTIRAPLDNNNKRGERGRGGSDKHGNTSWTK